MNVRDGFLETIGNTPLIRLKGPSQATGCTILGKAEFLNPGSSVKDRAALFIVRDAEEKGLLKPGGVIVEGTAGNTGIGLALVGNARGYRTVIVIPDTQSQEKKDMLRLCGADLREVPAVPYKDPNNYVHVSERLAKELAAREPNGVLWANQWDNTANRDGHYRSTGPEIWEQTGGRVDGFTCAIGTGGTLTGVSMFLKERRLIPAILLVFAVVPALAACGGVPAAVLGGLGSASSAYLALDKITEAASPVIATACREYDAAKAAADVIVAAKAVPTAIAAKVSTIQSFGDAACGSDAGPPAGDPVSTAIWLGRLAGQIVALTAPAH